MPDLNQVMQAASDRPDHNPVTVAYHGVKYAVVRADYLETLETLATRASKLKRDQDPFSAFLDGLKGGR